MTGDGAARRRTRLGALWSRRGRTRFLVVALVTAGLVGVGGYSLLAIQGRAAEEGQRADAAEVEAILARDNAQVIAEQVRDACRREGETAELLGDLCDQAEEVAEEPGEPTLVAPTDEQLRPLVEDWLRRNPPRDGTTPSVATISVLIAAELAENPPPRGERGPPGRPPTVEELRPIVADAVAAWLQANPPADGEPGRDGVDGQDGRDGVDGQDGVDGRDGRDGEPIDSWTFTHCGVSGVNCATYRCEQVPDFSPAAPEYDCQPVTE